MALTVKKDYSEKLLNTMPMSYWKKQMKAGRPLLGAMKELMQNTE